MLVLAACAPLAAWVAVSIANKIEIKETRNAPPASNLYALVFGMLAAIAIVVARGSMQAVEALLVVGAFAFFAAFDRRFLAVPVVPLLAFVGLGIALGVWSDPVSGALRACAALFGWSSMRLLAFAYRRVRGREGLGEGDALLAAALGGWLSFEGLAWAIGLGSAAALLLMRARKADRNQPVAFAPGLGAGASMFLIGAPLLGWAS